MRQSIRPELIVGIFGVVAFLIIVYMSREVSDTPFQAGEGAEYTVYFDSVSGLIPKTPVEIAGIQVGFVDTIGLEGQQAKLVLRIDPKVILYEDAKAAIASRGILGDKVLSVNPGSLGKRKLSSGDSIGSQGAGGDIEALFSTMEQAAVNITDLSAVLRDFVEQQVNGGNVDAILASIADLSGNLNVLVTENAKTLERILNNFDSVSGSLKDVVDSQMTGQLAESAASLERTLKTLEKIASAVERGEGTVGKLLRDETTITSINNAVSSIEKLTSGINKIQTEVRYRGEYLFDSEDLQNLVSLTIRPRPDKFFRFELVDSAVGDTNVTQTTVSSPPGNVLSTTETVETNDRILFSFELARRFYDATFRFGIIRNEGGVGLDYAFFDDMLVLTAEAFNFSRLNNNFQMRTYATLNLWKYLMVTAGVDDLLEENGNINPFFGTGISFRDDDIRSLFGIIALSGTGTR